MEDRNNGIYQMLAEMLKNQEISLEEEGRIRGLFERREDRRAEIRIAYELLNLLQQEVRNGGRPCRMRWSQYGDDIPDNFGMLLHQARLKAGITQKQLAGIAGIHQTEISRIERGYASPSLTTVKRLAEWLGMDVNFI